VQHKARIYNTAAASFGFQLGVQKKTAILVFMTEQAPKDFRNSSGHEKATFQMNQGGEMNKSITPRIFHPIMMMLSFFLINACAGIPSSSDAVTSMVSAENPVVMVNQLGGHIADARKNQLNVLSPTWYAKAEGSYLKAKNDLEQGKELLDIQKNVNKAETQLQKTEEMAKVSRATLGELIEARNKARAAGATDLGKDYVEAEKKFLKLTKAIEKNNLRHAQNNQRKLVKVFHQLEIRAIKEKTIGEVHKLIDQAEKAGAKKITPELLALVQDKLKETDEFITQNPYDKDTMRKKADDALFMAKRLHSLMDQSHKIKTMTPEQIALSIEEVLYKTTSKLLAPDMRDQNFEVQVENILGSIGALQSDHDFIIAEVKSQQEQIETLNRRISLLEKQTRRRQAEKESLAAEKQFNQLFNEVQTFFDRDEAEAYKQKNQLVIRLKVIKFPVGQSTLMPRNYSLMTKVQRAIRIFGEPRVLVEGHTDSTGSDAVNEHLSQQRAEAVREYLIANKTLPSDKIVAVGYGSARPLESNATPEGRAINRRIDVIITPTVKPAP
jgi:outer membrane protein OmpA-like peptidoglycan-associated protein